MRVAALVLLWHAACASDISSNDSRDVIARALPDSPSGNYAPAIVKCPSDQPTIRSAGTISRNESNWIRTRRAKTVDPMIQFLSNANIPDFDAKKYISSIRSNFTVLPNIAIAASGGGYRALMNGAGFLAAADSRVAGTNNGSIGGLLQSSTYLAGLSGGGWLVGSFYANNQSTIPELRDGSSQSSLWAFNRSIFEGPKQDGTLSYWSDLYDDVQKKRDAGYNASITDYWGRALSYQLLNTTKGGLAYTFSSISRQDGFSNASFPLPIIVANERLPNSKVISTNSTVIEFNPWEMGSFDPNLFGFAPLEYLGSNFSAGHISKNGSCVRGFDQYGYVLGTSSSLFNQILLRNLSDYNIPKVLQSVIKAFADDLSESDDDIAQYKPNPFLDYNADSNKSANQTQLSLVDGGEDGQNIPLHPLIQPERAVDIIFAIDSSADTSFSWPNGTALRATYDRSLKPIGNGTQFPAIPSAETFINLGLNRRPTAFGCDIGNFTANNTATSSNGTTTVIPPLILYIPNTAYNEYSNVSTFTMSYENWHRNNIIENGFNVATMGNGSVQAGVQSSQPWSTCAACFVLQRSFAKTRTNVPSACQQCYKSFCWDGTTNETRVNDFQPTPFLKLSASQSSAIGGRANMPDMLTLVAFVSGLLGFVLV